MSIQEDNIKTVFRHCLLERDTEKKTDLTGATTLEIHFRKPDLTTVNQTAVLFGPGTDGCLEYETAAGDLNANGPWKRQAHVVLAGGEDIKGQVHDFEGLANII